MLALAIIDIPNAGVVWLSWYLSVTQGSARPCREGGTASDDSREVPLARSTGLFKWTGSGVRWGGQGMSPPRLSGVLVGGEKGWALLLLLCWNVVEMCWSPKPVGPPGSRKVLEFSFAHPCVLSRVCGHALGGRIGRNKSMPSCQDWKSPHYIFNAVFTVLLKYCKAVWNLALFFFWQFNFLNCFASLFYIAFVLRDMKLLRQVSD